MNFNNGRYNLTNTLLISLLSGYLGIYYLAYILFLPYIFIALNNFVKKNSFKFSSVIVFTFTSIIIIISVIYNIYTKDVLAAFLTIKYFYGFSFFLIVFSVVDIENIEFDKILSYVIFATLIEAILINSLLTPDSLLNYPKSLDGEFLHPGKFWGLYFRPYGIGFNPSVTSSIIFIIYAFLDSFQFHRKKIIHFYLTLLCLLVLMSGTGIFLFLSYNLFKLFNKKLYFFVAGFLLFFTYYLTFNYFIPDIDQSNIKIAPFYVDYLIDFKIDQIENAFLGFSNIFEILLGKTWDSNNPMPLGGDFGLLNIFEYMGILPFISIVFILILYCDKKSKSIFSILFLGAIHYTAIFTLPGQIFFSLLLSININRKNLYTNPQIIK